MTMTVAFNRVPTNIRVPFFYAEINSGVNYYQGNSRLLLIGQMANTGSATANIPILIDHIPTDLFGAGSMLVDMVVYARKAYALGEIWALPLSDPTGVKATATITPTAPNVSGTLTFYVCGQKLQIAVLATDTAVVIGANIAAAITAGYVMTDGQSMNFPVAAVAHGTTGVVTVTAMHVGTLGNLLSIDKDLVGDEGPLASSIAIANFGSGGTLVAGTGVPSLTAGLANLGDDEFDWIACPYADTTSLNSLRDLLSGTGGRWDPTIQLYGHAITVFFGILSAAATLGTGRNDPHVSIMPVANSPSPPWCWAASLGGIILLHKNLGADLSQAGEISRPLQTLLLPGILPPKLRADRWDRGERQTLYYDGMSGYTVGADGQVYLDRVVTTYRLNSWGQPDTTWLDIETLAQTVYATRFIRQYITQKHPRDALVDDNPMGLQGFTTPKDLKGDVIHAYSKLVDAGVMKNLQLFSDNLETEKATDPNRVNTYLPFDVVNQLRIFAANETVYLDAAVTN
jgi:phage tail sheath gpL-like